MSEQSRSSESGQSPKDPCGSNSVAPPSPKTNPGGDPRPGDGKPPCPPDEKCPEPKCPEPCPPTFTPPDWCEELPEEPTEHAEPEPEPEPPTTNPDDPCGPSPSLPEQLARLKASLTRNKKELRDLEPKQKEGLDLEERIKNLQERVNDQTKKDKEYKEFYRDVELVRNDIECFIPTARCHLELKDFQKRCVCAAIERVDKRIAKAKREADHADIRARWAERRYKEANVKREWAEKYFKFIETNLLDRVKAVKDELLDLKKQVLPSEDQCVAFFYIYELERLIKTFGGDHRCWEQFIGVGDFLDCWQPDCYGRARNRMLSEYNDAAAAEKLLESQRDQANALATKLRGDYEAAEKRRRADILAEIAADDCCAACPPSAKEGAGREAR